MEKLSFRVAGYDAPLDLILSLISKHKLDIVDIDISSLLKQYLETIELWREQDMDIASEFLEMASRLVHMKTISLLPRHEEESERLKEELTGSLIEYGLCKLAARQLSEIDVSGSMFVREPAEIEIDKTYTLTHTAALLYQALADAQGKGERKLPPPRESFDPIVTGPAVSVTSRIFYLLRRLRKAGNIPLDALFEPSGGRSAMIATFLAVLELVKSGKITLAEDGIRIHGA